MRANIILFTILTVFCALLCAVYTVWSLIDPLHGRVEWVGTVTLALAAILSAFLGFYLSRVHKSQGAELPEDTLTANIDDGDPEIGHFSPWSWWPIILAGACGLLVLGLAVGFWIAIIGIPLVVIAVVGWNYEYYRGYFAR
ncbi:cytochrome c oxidase subunit IV [Plantibacter sp. Leaf171]|uniref:cytochrome c oxidase subunit 4 n=1 Tax=unclassified Plantibacter TaxID=2624265 RepID=UPI00070141EB|nr:MULTISPECIES: cytochrome c oxidase subunit 4 [unclassified Plantibacter]KQM14991.1 cytochrome c oxidase subunit IV [Plantibacter sp. Leaf1]KQQ51052.1 cytochrome c oxidase subunit IV [Plantibacter sp. Leaf314]KQR58134.1 cytochrome c oxidase subunit IV [Plantibacter sp. Leaf171]